MKIQIALAALVLALSPTAFAQPRGNNGGQNNGAQTGGRGGQNGGTLPLPKGINRVISIDAYNVLLAEVSDDDGNRDYAPITVRHVYSGGIAALFGGTSIPTAQFVSPGASNMGGGNQGGVGFGGGFGGGGGNFGGGGFGGGGNFGGGGFGGGNNFGGGNFGGVSGFNGAGINQGFNGAGNGQIFQTQNGNIGFGQTSVVNRDGTTTPLANGPFVR